MRVISRERLKAELDRGEKITLVMALGAYAYHLLHIPGSLNFDDLVEELDQMDRDAEVIVYCSNLLCSASINAYEYLRSRGFTNLYRFAGGLEAWLEAGCPLEGRLADEWVAPQLV